MGEGEIIDCIIPLRCAGRRLDQALAELVPYCSRARLQRWIKEGCIRVDGRTARPRDQVVGGEQVSGYCPAQTDTVAKPQPIALDVIYADSEILIVNKAPGLVTHPAAGNPDGTLLNGLLHYAPELRQLPRAGLVHRLDKETSGLLVVARSLRAHSSLVRQLQARTVEREYMALVNGILVAGGSVEAPIGRHPVERKRMAVVAGGKAAVTHYWVRERFRAHTLLKVKLESGRTHQIRVHLAYKHYPLLGDPVYGGRLRIAAGMTQSCAQMVSAFRRQALHAKRLGLMHPSSGEYMQWHAEPPHDFVDLLGALRKDIL